MQNTLQLHSKGSPPSFIYGLSSILWLSSIAPEIAPSNSASPVGSDKIDSTLFVPIMFKRSSYLSASNYFSWSRVIMPSLSKSASVNHVSISCYSSSVKFIPALNAPSHLSPFIYSSSSSLAFSSTSKYLACSLTKSIF